MSAARPTEAVEAWTRVPANRAAVRVLSVPAIPSVTTVNSAIDSVFMVLLRIEDSDGVPGFGCLWTFEPAGTPLLVEAIRFVAPVLISAEGSTADEIYSAVLKRIRFLGLKAVTVFGLSALDMAVHDLLSRRIPRHPQYKAARMRNRVSAYWSGLHLGATEYDLAAEVAERLDQGFRAFKIRVGHADPGQDLRRLAFVRSLIPAEVSLAVDAVQAWTADEAIRFSLAAAEYGVWWFEDPVLQNDYSGLARVIEESPIPIATGENEYLPEGFEQLWSLSPHYVLADPQRVGGISGWLRVAEAAERHHTVLTPHLYPHLAIQLMAGLPGDAPLEFVTWWDPLMSYELSFKDGVIDVPDVAGTGLDFDPQAIEHFAISPWQTL